MEIAATDTIQIANESLLCSKLAPFGLRLTPQNSVDNLQEWVKDNQTIFFGLATTHGLIIIDNVIPDVNGEYDIIPYDKKIGRFPHTDFLSQSTSPTTQVKLLVWQIDGEKRAPTCFISDPIASKLIQNTEIQQRIAFIIDLALVGFQDYDFSSELEFAFKSLLDNSQESFYKRQIPLYQFRRSLLRYKGLSTLTYANDQIRDYSPEDTPAHEAKLALPEILDDFASRLKEILLPATYAHHWNSHNNSAVICCNSLLNNDHANTHFSVPPEEGETADLKRFGLQANGKLILLSAN